MISKLIIINYYINLVLNFRIRTVELEHNASLSGAITAMRQDEQQRIAEVEDKVKQDEEVRYTYVNFYGSFQSMIINSDEKNSRTSKANA